MEFSFSCEHRDYLRIKANIPVRYRFLSTWFEHPGLQEVFSGKSRDLSGGGILLEGKLPDESWIPDLLIERITVAVSIYLPDAEEPVRARARVAWVNTGEPQDLDSCRMGLRFVEISRDGQDRIFRYILEDLVP